MKAGAIVFGGAASDSSREATAGRPGSKQVQGGGRRPERRRGIELVIGEIGGTFVRPDDCDESPGAAASRKPGPRGPAEPAVASGSAVRCAGVGAAGARSSSEGRPRPARLVTVASTGSAPSTCWAKAARGDGRQQRPDGDAASVACASAAA